MRASYFAAMIFTLISGYFIYVAWTMDTTLPGGIANLQLMHIQGLNLQIGLAAGIIAAIFWAAAINAWNREG